jgi:dolichol-phosphate mannosyltransferase
MDGGNSPACSLSLVIPAYNEADGIAHAIDEADAALALLGHTYEIIIVDDGSRDATAESVRAATRQHPSVRLVQHAENQGYGAALRSGFAAARGERIAFTDADCQFDLADLAPLLELTNEHPIAVGYRVGRQDSWLRKFYSRGYNLLARTLLGTRVRDIDCALKVFRREALAQILPETRGFFVNTEMLTRARQRHLHVAETGVRHRPRLRGSSKVSLFDIPRTLNALTPFWWSQVMFPKTDFGFENSSAMPTALRGHGHARPRAWHPILFLAVLALMAGLLFFGQLGAPLLEPEEARYAEISRQMLAEGSLLTPVLHGEAYYQKPPLLYWLVMGCYRVFGVHDWAARLAPAATGVFIELLTYAWAARAVGRGAALAGAAILCLSARFIYQAGMLSFDAPLCLFTLAALACAHRALDGAKLARGLWLAAGVACGLGVLTKGPVALALVVPPLVAWQFVERRTARLSWRVWLGFIGAAAAIAGPWFAAVAWRDPQALGEFLWLHNLVRYVAPLDHAEPVWFYLPALVVGTLPWSLLLIPMVRYLTKRSASAGRRRPPALGFFLLALGWCVLFFSLSGCKRAGYILPAYPLLALTLGTYLANATPWRRWALALPGRTQLAWNAWAHRATLGALACAIVVCGTAAARGWWPWPLALGGNLMLLALAAILWQRGPSCVAWRAGALCGGAVFALLLASVHWLLPHYHRDFALRGQVRRHFELANERNLPVASYPKRWESISFYLQRDDVEVYAPPQRAELIRDLQKQGQTLLFVKQGEALADLLHALPGDMEFVQRGRTGRIVSGIVQTKKME